ncbi:MAG: glycosyltransferase [Ignavibacteriales bacterium]|nr:glycosyltransferase [Ignavibacteriales bacterium]
MTEFYSAVFIGFLFAYLFFVFGIIRAPKNLKKRSNNGEAGYFSIVVAARNEENNITSLLESFILIKFPTSNYEIIICDDHSTDATASIVKSYQERIPNLQLVSPSTDSPRGKRAALQAGITIAKHDRVIITDDDCVTQAGWLSELDKCFTSDTQFLIAHAPLIKNSGFVNSISCFENMRSFMLITSSFGWGHPVSATARNMGFRKDIFHAEGGYTPTAGSLGGDDDLLLKNFLDKGYTINLATSPESAVFSHTSNGFRQYFRQKARHTAASKFYSKQSKWILVLWHLPNLYAQSSILFLPFFPEVSFTFFIKILFDLILVLSLQKKYNYNFNPFQVVFFQIFYEIFLIINYFTSRFTKFNWK